MVLLAGLLWALTFPLSTADSTQRCFSRDDDTQPFLSFTQTPTRRVESSAQGLELLYKFACAFLDCVQPNAFPEEIVSKALKNEQQNIHQLVRYEAGYLVCLILAVLYLLLMPIAGAVLAWQHFHCRKAEWNTQSRFHQNVGVATGLILTTLLLLVAVFLSFTANNKVRENIHPSLTHLDTSMRIMEDSLYSVPQKMEFIIEQYAIPKAEISKEINDVDDTIGTTIILSLKSDVNSAHTQLAISVAEAIGTIDNLHIVQATRANLQRRHIILQRDLQSFQERLQVLSANCTVCDVPEPTNLETDADYSQIPSVNDTLNKMPPAVDLEDLAEQVNSSFQSLPQNFSDQVAPTTTALIMELNETQESLMTSSRSLPSMQSLTEGISELRASVRRFAGLVEHYDYVRWAVAVVLCTVMLAIALLMTAAVSLGLPVLFYPTIYSTYPDGRLERTAVGLFRASVLLSFSFSWLFIILVFVTLFFGGNVHALACRSWTNGQLFEFLDNHEDVFRSLNFSQSSHATQMTPSTHAIYQGCDRGESLFHSMHLNQLFDLEDLLNSTKYLEGFSQAAQNMSINLDGLKLLPDQGRQSLLDFKKIGLEDLDYESLQLLLSRPVVKRDLGALANELDEKAKLPENEAIKTQLEEEASIARDLDTIVTQQMTDAGKMNKSAEALRDISKTYMGNVDKTLGSFNKTDDALQTLVPLVVANVSQCTLEKGEQSLLRYLDWVRQAILNEVLGCHWLAVSFDNVYTAVCVNVLDPWNAFWLCLGWCCAFLVPGVVFSIYVARCLRPTALPPSFIGKDTIILAEKTKSNIYMAFEDIHDLSISDNNIKGKEFEDN